ncbi:MAG: hypothetical protein PHE49_08190, partial [bacterium]|nr:hypothetical protein [bacterium]
MTESIRNIVDIMSDFKKPWYIAGGWAIDLHICHKTREHNDIEIVIFRKDQVELRKHLKSWKFEKVVPVIDGLKRDLWGENEELYLPV